MNSLVDSLIEGAPRDKTLLLVDSSDNEDSLEFFLQSSKYLVLDAEKMHKKLYVKKSPLELVLEEARFQLVYAMKYGKILVVRLGITRVDLQGCFCDECCTTLQKKSKWPPYLPQLFLPRGFLLLGGAHLHEPDMVEQLYRREDVLELQEDDLEAVCHPSFRIVVSTALEAHTVQDQLFNKDFGLPGNFTEYNIQSLLMRRPRGINQPPS